MTVESPTTGSEEERLTFDQLPLPAELLAALRDVGYVHPTPVQAAAIGPALAGKDLVVQARTGTGKTAAFGLPLLAGRVNPEKKKAQALILAPTRELALQVKAEIERLSKHTSLAICSVYGGAPIGRQIDELAAGAHIVVGTPGRVLDHLERRTLNLSELRVFILDECDEMLSMGFLPQINAIWEQLPKGHQTYLFSATIPKEVLRIAETRLSDPELITLSGDHIGALEIQHFVYLSHGDKLQDLLSIIEVENPKSAIVFCNTKDETKRVTKNLQAAGYSAEWLNADLSQSEREKVMAQTRAGELRFLVCTDVAARGIDISHLTHVINFDFPESSEQYVHRTGRTGRAGKLGTAIALVAPEAIGNLYYLRLKYKIQPIERHLPSRREVQTRREADALGLLELQFPTLPVDEKYRSLARRLLTHERSESVIGGLLRLHLGDADERAAEARKNGSVPGREGAPPPPIARDKRVEPKARQTADEGSRDGQTRRRGRSAGSARDDRRGPPPGPSFEGPPNGDEDFEFRYEVSDAPPTTAVESARGAAPKETTNGERERRPRRVDGRPRHNEGADETSFVNLFVGVGRRDGATPEALKQALRDAGCNGSTGRIAVRERHSFVEVPPEVSDEVISKLHGTTLCGRETIVEVARPRS